MNRTSALTILFCLPILFSAGGSRAQDNVNFWWPEQSVPARCIVCVKPRGLAESVVAQAAAGLSARAVNEGRWDSMIWIEHPAPMYDGWMRSTVRANKIKKGGTADVWEIVERMRRQDLVKGYILYSSADGSLNAATMYAGLLGGVPVAESLRQKAENAGLKMLHDARGETADQVLENHPDGLSRGMVVVMRDDLPFNRDLAVGRATPVWYGVDSLYFALLERMEPLSPVVGWNSGPESGHIAPPSEYGLFNTASDYSSGLTFLSAGARRATVKKARPAVDPARIDFDAPGSFHAFVMSDGDNMQWTMNGFFGDDYYLSRAAAKFPLNWTSCPVNMSQAAPAVWNRVVEKQRPNSTLVEFSGGYQYADIFASRRADRWELLSRYARQTGEHMSRTGVTVLNLMMRHDVGSPDALRAYEIYARQIDNLTGIIAIQYNPYHGGGGEIFWVANREGIEIPVVTSRYSMWGKIDQPGFGRPDQVAEWINADAADGRSLAWTMVHAWSRYGMDGQGRITDAENDRQDGVRGALAAKWCVDRVDAGTKIVSLEELLWRIRAAHDPQTTRKIIEKR